MIIKKGISVVNGRGILAYASYLPRWRLDLAEVSAFLGKGGGSGTRAVASYDQDTTTLGVEAARRAVAGLTQDSRPEEVWFATSDPAYVDKTNANAIQAALRFGEDVATMDMVGAVRCGFGALRIALGASGRDLVVAADTRSGLPGSHDEASGGDGAAAVLVGSAAEGDLLATHVASASAVSEFLERWRIPGDPASGVWEERMGESVYEHLFADAWKRACRDAEVEPEGVDRLVLTGTHDRAVRRAASQSGVPRDRHTLSLSKTVGNTGAADPLLLLASVLDIAGPNETVAVVCLADGADVVIFQTTEALATSRQSIPVRAQIDDSLALGYGRFLAWRSQLHLDPPRRPHPDRVSGAAAARNEEWKFGLVASQDRSSGAIHMPPARVSMWGDAVDDMEPFPMSDAIGTISTFTVDHMTHTPSPPIVFAVIDYDDGARFACELTDVAVEDIRIGGRVEMTFRRLFTEGGIHNYFWKARPVGSTTDEE